MGTSGSGEGTPPLRVLLVDDHEVVRAGLRALLEGAEGVAVAGEAATAAEAVTEAVRARPDVAIVDVRLPDASGIEVCRELRSACPGTRVIMLTAYADEDALFAAILAGAAGYLLKQTRGADLVEAVRTVHAGGSLLDPAVTGQVLRRLRHADRPAAEGSDPPLTDLEQRIVALMAEGKTNREIAETVFLSDKTVKHYVSSILHKLGVGRRSEAAAWWARLRRGGA
jgi:DNA-binding NarL/FixJ family response regulator